MRVVEFRQKVLNDYVLAAALEVGLVEARHQVPQLLVLLQSFVYRDFHVVGAAHEFVHHVARGQQAVNMPAQLEPLPTRVLRDITFLQTETKLNENTAYSLIFSTRSSIFRNGRGRLYFILFRFHLKK